MPRTPPYSPRPQPAGLNPAAHPFDSAEAAWFWFIQAQQAHIDGARLKAGAGFLARPCEPLDILHALDRLYRARDLGMDHLLVLRHYGRRMLAPDPARPKERRAHALWTEALTRLGKVLEEKKIIRPQGIIPHWLYAPNVIAIAQYRKATQ